MFRIRRVIVLALAAGSILNVFSVLPVAVSAEDADAKPMVRQWTTRDGRYAVDALFVEQTEAEVVLERKDDGRRVRVSLDKLSDADRLYLEKRSSAVEPVGSAKEPTEIAALDHTLRLAAVAFSPDGKMVAGATVGGLPLPNVVKLWDVSKKAESDVHIDVPSQLWNWLAFSPDGNSLAGASMTNSHAYVWDTATGQETAKLEHKGSVWSVAWAPDSKRLAIPDEFGQIVVWDVASGEHAAVFQATKDRALAAAFSPDGNLLAGGTRDDLVLLWDMKTKEVRSKLEGHDGAIRFVSFSPDGTLLASAGSDATVKLWNVEKAEEVATLEGHAGEIVSLAFSPDGRFVATAGLLDDTVKLWDVDAHKEVTTIKLDRCMTGVAFSPDGKLLATAGYDGKLRLWDVSYLGSR